jgi:hypothetical protein
MLTDGRTAVTTASGKFFRDHYGRTRKIDDRIGGERIEVYRDVIANAVVDPTLFLLIPSAFAEA